MKNMKKRLMDEVKYNVSKALGYVAIKSGEAATEKLCIGFGYEPSVPHELLELNKEKEQC
ncbi:cyclic lactone autoinducer peptide [Bacillus mycoides]|jgi:cyclic lactone autoinducer peptide|uniref:cyclic lactone autoinducer peptide n=1 Tax=Bacillus mycoides TaxID=1405 RepID=UPI003D011114